MDTNFLSRSNELMNGGAYAIQGHRIAKNIDARFSNLDAISEEINNSIFRKGHVAIGLSSALIGSGMALEYKLYRRIMAQADTFAEDKELEFKLILEKHPIEYLEDVHIYDEKVSKAEVFVNQRSRWLAFQLIYAKRFIFDAFVELFVRKNIDFFDKVMQQLLPPRIILLGITFIFAVLSAMFNVGFLYYAWMIQAMVCFTGILLAIPKQFFNKNTFKALFSLPYGFILMLKSLFRYEDAKKSFEPTPHIHTSISRGKTSDKTKKIT
jgi:cellulose synthase/poly-beta-1,6-N-acetylglucosamine synthase-like glycosyltransferase